MTRTLGIKALLLVGLLAACNNGAPGDGEEGEPSAPFSVPPGCDPDGGEPCPLDWFLCTADDAGDKHCEGQIPAAPDNGSWSCEVVEGQLRCVGDHLPDGRGIWECVEDGDEVLCTSEIYEPATDGGATDLWDCFYAGEFLICESGDYEGPGVPPEEPPDGPEPPIDNGIDFCFFNADDPDSPPLVSGWYAFETVEGHHAVHVMLILNENFVDNTYGVNSSSGYDHTFRDLVGSDKSEVGFVDGEGTEVLRARFDYISESDEAPSGYDCLGVTDGDGRMIEGDEASVLEATSSLDRNLNELGCVFVEDSPIDDECPGWDYRVIYEMWIDADVFGAAGFSAVAMSEVHASPSRTDNTIPLVPGPCP